MPRPAHCLTEYCILSACLLPDLPIHPTMAHLLQVIAYKSSKSKPKVT